jgi:hypothetical protein
MHRPFAKSAFATVAWLYAAAGLAHAQSAQITGGGLNPPQNIVLYVHFYLKDTDFVEQLVRALRQVLTTGVNAGNMRLPLGSALLAPPTQFDMSKVSDQFVRAASADGDRRPTNIFLFPWT